VRRIRALNWRTTALGRAPACGERSVVPLAGSSKGYSHPSKKPANEIQMEENGAGENDCGAARAEVNSRGRTEKSGMKRRAGSLQD